MEFLTDFVRVADREDPGCGWVGGQCWSNTACNAIGIAWSIDGSVWEEAEHVPTRINYYISIKSILL